MGTEAGIVEMSERNEYYITTPIYYPSGDWHIGTCYTTVVCDAIARFRRMEGRDVFYLTGTDEHGQNIERLAARKGVAPLEYVDERVAALKKLWARLGITYDKFIRTTDPAHEKAVQGIFRTLFDKGDIYKGEYEGWYCAPCESFWTETQLRDGKCPDCGRAVEKTRESSYFFRLSKYRDRLIDLIENTDFLLPESRRNEMLNNFLRAGLRDLAISRTSFKWGIPVPFDPKHVVYVWLDALSNYITALGYGSDDDSLFRRFWPADCHMVGKEIVRFHSVVWPALLMALDLPLPKCVYGHGWLLFGRDKMSKSKGNVVDPIELSDRYGVDAVRYYLLREIPFGADGSFAYDEFLLRTNADLCNALGNLLNRTTAMISKYFGGKLPKTERKADRDAEIESLMNGLAAKMAAHMNAMSIPEALGDIFELVNRANKYIDETMPWKKTGPDDAETLKSVMYHLAEALRIVGIALLPFIPDSARRILADLSVEAPKEFGSALRYGVLREGARIAKSAPLFKRIDVKKEVEATERPTEPDKPRVKEAPNPEPSANARPKAEIGIEEFDKIELRVGTILAAEKIERSRKLLRLEVDTGDRVRTIVSGVAKHFAPEDLVGKEAVAVVNLAPIRLGGTLSEGMLLFAETRDGRLVPIAPDGRAGSGASVC